MEQDRKYTYRIVFIPETIGSIIYTCLNFEHLQKNVKAGYVLTCVGDDRGYSFLPSRKGGTLADRAALHCLTHMAPSFRRYTFLDRGSDERQYCSPHVDLPVASVMRTKYGMYPEYHTSGDDLDLISPKGLDGALKIYKAIIRVLENNGYYTVTTFCEPQLGKRGLNPTISTKDSWAVVRDLRNVIAYCDGTLDLINLADIVGVTADQVIELIQPLLTQGLVKRLEAPINLLSQ